MNTRMPRCVYNANGSYMCEYAKKKHIIEKMSNQDNTSREESNQSKYIEYMSASDICNSTNSKLLKYHEPKYNYGSIVNSGSFTDPAYEYRFAILPKNVVISGIGFTIISTDQKFSGEKNGTQYELVLRYDNIDHSLTNLIWCVDFINPKSDNFIKRINKVSNLYRFKPFLKTENKDVKLLFKLYNRAPGYQAVILHYNIEVRYCN